MLTCNLKKACYNKTLIKINYIDIIAYHRTYTIYTYYKKQFQISDLETIRSLSYSFLHILYNIYRG